MPGLYHITRNSCKYLYVIVFMKTPTKSTGLASRIRMASATAGAVNTIKPCESRFRSSISRVSGASSTTSMLSSRTFGSIAAIPFRFCFYACASSVALSTFREG